MTNQIRGWLASHGGIFEELNQAMSAATKAAGDTARSIEAGAGEVTVQQHLAGTSTLAGDFLGVVNRAAALPPIPDEDTAELFGRALNRWGRGAEAERDAARQRDVQEFYRAGAEIDAGADDFYRMAAALRRATGQQPDPRNPLA